MRTAFTLFFSLSVCLFAHTQTPALQSEYAYAYETLDKDQVKNDLNRKNKFYDEQEWEEIKKAMQAANEQLNQQVKELEERLAPLHKDLKILLANNTFKEKQQEILKIEQGKAETQREMELQLQDLEFQGLFVVMLRNVPPLMSEADKMAILKNKLLPDAVATCKGVRLRSETRIENGSIVSDKLDQLTSGQMGLEKIWSAENKKEGISVYVVKAKIEPLKEELETEELAAGESSGAIPAKIMDIGNGNLDGVRKQLAQNPDLLQKFEDGFAKSEWEKQRQSVQEANKQTQAKEKRIADENQEALKETEEKIKKAIADKETLKRKLGEIGSKHGIALFVGEDLDEQALNRLIARIEDQKRTLKAQKRELKSQEVVMEEFPSMGQSGEPAESLAGAICRRADAMGQNYKEVKGFSQALQMENNMISSITQKSSSKVERIPKQVWAFPMLRDEGFQVAVVMRFEVLESEASKAETPLTKVEPKQPAKPVVLTTKPPTTEPTKPGGKTPAATLSIVGGWQLADVQLDLNSLSEEMRLVYSSMGVEESLAETVPSLIEEGFAFYFYQGGKVLISFEGDTDSGEYKLQNKLLTIQDGEGVEKEIEIRELDNDKLVMLFKESEMPLLMTFQRSDFSTFGPPQIRNLDKEEREAPRPYNDHSSQDDMQPKQVEVVENPTPPTPTYEEMDPQETENSYEIANRLVMARRAFNDKRYTEAYDTFIRYLSKDEFSTEDRFCLAYIYYNGLAGAADYNQAFYHANKAAQGGSAAAQNLLGQMYYEGKAVVKNETTAFEYFLKAANAGNTPAQYHVGLFYEKGVAVKANLDKAVQYYRTAAAQGHAKAKQALQRLGY